MYVSNTTRPPQTIGWPRRERFALRDVVVIDMTGGPPSPGMTVVVDNGIIAAIAPEAEVNLLADTVLIEGHGGYLIPGLFDMHAHVVKAGETALLNMLRSGVTSLRDMGGDIEPLLEQRRRIAQGDLIGPRITTAGAILESRAHMNQMIQDGTPLDILEKTRVSVGDREEAFAGVYRAAAAGAEFIKVRTIESNETYAAIAEASRAVGLPLTGHFLASLEETILAGQSSIEHVMLPPLDDRSTDERRSLFARMAAQGVAIVPTIRKLQIEYGDHELFPVYQRGVFRDLAEMHAEGVPVLVGTDYNISLHDELEQLVVKVGMTPQEVLIAATKRSAQWLDLDWCLGTIEVGKLADMIVLEANPLDDIANARNIRAVYISGVKVDSGYDA